MKRSKLKKVVLAYSGGLDTSVIIPWLREKYGCEVIAMVANLGQGEDLDAIKEKAEKSGASRVYVEDLRRDFVLEYAFPTMRAGAVYEGKYLLGTSFARPLIAKRQVEVALAEGATAVSHGCTGKGNDQVRFELTYKALSPELKVIAPWREWDLRSREDEIEFAHKHGVPVPVTKEKPYSMDRNLWHISYEGGELEDPWIEPEESMFLWTVAPSKAPDEPGYVEIFFEKGFPRALNGREYDSVALLEKLNDLGARHGVGRADLVENRLVGMKSRGVYETPGGTILYTAHRELESITLDRDTIHHKELMSPKYAELVYYGQWYSPLKKALDAYVDSTQERVTGSVRLRLFKGSATVAGRSSPYSLYSLDLATFGEDQVYRQNDAEGFINLFGLPCTVQARLNAALREMSEDRAGDSAKQTTTGSRRKTSQARRKREAS